MNGVVSPSVASITSNYCAEDTSAFLRIDGIASASLTISACLGGSFAFPGFFVSFFAGAAAVSTGGAGLSFARYSSREIPRSDAFS